MSRSYLPTIESDLVRWLQDFHRNLAGDPAGYGTTAAHVAEVGTIIDRFIASYHLAGDALTRTPVAVEQKQNVKKAAVCGVRLLVRELQAWPQMTNAKRVALGITVPDRNPTPVRPPLTSPLLEVLAVSGRTLILRLGNHDAPTRRTKPGGVRQGVVYVYAGEAPPADVGDWKLQAATGRTEILTTLPAMMQPGTKIWISACWLNSRNERGPYSPAVVRHVNFDEFVQAA